MGRRFDESELLAWVEGELPAERAAALERRLAAADPALLRLLEGMRCDRDALRSAPEADVPADFLAEVEPLLARPMLIPPPGELRRRYRRRRRRLAPTALLAAAAVLAIAIGARLWLTSGRPGPAGPPPALPPDVHVSAAVDDRPQHRETAPASDPAAPTGLSWATEPRRPPDGVPGRGGSPRGSGATVPLKSGPPVLVEARFALVLPASEVAGAEELLCRAVAGIEPGAAVVRNLSEAEVALLAERLSRATAQRGGEPDLADIGAEGRGGELLGIVQRRRAQGRGRPASAPEVPPAVQLSGPRQLCPDYEKQLGFSARGASHTVCVPAEELPGLLSRLQLLEGRQTRLRMLPEKDAAGTAAPDTAAAWLESYAAARESAARLVADHPGAVIILPVIIERPR